MGLQVYLSEKELIAVIDSASEWVEIMSSGDENSFNEVEKRLNEGLGAALYKLCKGRNGQQSYKSYTEKSNK